MFKHLFIYEINTSVFLQSLSVKYHMNITLSSIPDQEWQCIKDLGFKYVWMMGVWQRSEKSKKCALEDSQLQKSYDNALAGWKGKDVIGSPYAIYSYTLDSNFGIEKEVAYLKTKLNKIGLSLILDFVVNHLAVDHPWTQAYPERFISTEKDIADTNTELFYKTENNCYIAHGRDPNYAGWTDTAQLNIFSKDTRKALVGELINIAQVANGVRCDMAMLSLNDVFLETWGQFAGKDNCVLGEFWEEAIKTVKKKYPDFIFIAECYWGLEWDLQQLGFDYTYDKKLYDRLMSTRPEGIRGHLMAEQTYQEKCVRFIENHDENRSIVAFGADRVKAAAVISATIPGLCLYYDGQLVGNAVKCPVQLKRVTQERDKQELHDFYTRLLAFCLESPIRNGSWKLLETISVATDNFSHSNILSWQWNLDRQSCLVVVNYSAVQSQARVYLSMDELRKSNVVFKEFQQPEEYTYKSEDIIHQGIYVDLKPWSYHLFQINLAEGDL